MAEAVGLALGVASLAGLFGAAVEAFDQVKAAKSFSRDYEILATRYDIRRATLLQWGTAVGLSSGSNCRRNPMLDQKSLRPLLERALNCIRMLLTDGNNLQDKYGLQQVQPEDVTQDESDPATLLGTSFSRPRLNRFRSSYNRFLTNIKDRQKNTSFMRKTQWAIVGSSEFRMLLRDLDDLIEDLYKLVPVSLAEQMQLIQEDAAALPKDPEQLRLFQEALAENEESSDGSSLSDDPEPTTNTIGTAPPASSPLSNMKSFREPISARFASVASSKASWITALSYQASLIEETSRAESRQQVLIGQSNTCYSGLCESARRLCEGASMEDVFKQDLSKQKTEAPARAYYCVEPGCDFHLADIGRTVLHGGSTIDLHNDELRLKYRTTFLAKSHLRSVSELRSDPANFHCLICTEDTKKSAIFAGVGDLLAHLSSHVSLKATASSPPIETVPLLFTSLTQPLVFAKSYRSVATAYDFDIWFRFERSGDRQ